MTLQVEMDRDSWVYVPSEWPWGPFETSVDWRDALVAAIGDAQGYGEGTREWLAATLDGIVASSDAQEHRFAYLAAPLADLAVVSVYELPRYDAPDDELLGVGDPTAVRPPVVAEFAGGGLGDGRKSLRFVADPDDADSLSGIAHWVWRLDDRDVVMIVGDGDLARFQRLQDTFDALARAITTIDDPADTPAEGSATDDEGGRA